MEIVINNILFNFQHQSHDALPDQENIGLADLIIPGRMSKRFAKECGIEEDDPRFKRNKFIMPHYDSYAMEDVDGSDHACYNADTQIVLMSWLFEKRRKYKLDYNGLDPYWLFHDSFHAENDVYGYEVNGISSWVEHARLLEGAEFAKSRGVYIQPDTAAKLIETWKGRWRSEKGNRTALKSDEFLPFIKKGEDVELYEMHLECGIFNTN